MSIVVVVEHFILYICCFVLYLYIYIRVFYNVNIYKFLIDISILNSIPKFEFYFFFFYLFNLLE